MGDGSTLGLFGFSEYKYKSAYFVGLGLGAGSWFTGGGEAAASTKIGAKFVEKGGLHLFKWKDGTSLLKPFNKEGDHFLYLSNRGSEKANWKQNSGYLREAMRSGNPIFDSYTKSSGELIKEGLINGKKNTFINAERYLLESRGWKYNASTGAWHAP